MSTGTVRRHPNIPKRPGEVRSSAVDSFFGMHCQATVARYDTESTEVSPRGGCGTQNVNRGSGRAWGGTGRFKEEEIFHLNEEGELFC